MGLTQVVLSLGTIGALTTIVVGTFGAAAIFAACLIAGAMILNHIWNKLPDCLSRLNEEIKNLKDTDAGLAGETSSA